LFYDKYLLSRNPDEYIEIGHSGQYTMISYSYLVRI